MILDATLLSHAQSCARRPLLESDWLVRKHRAKSLFDMLLVRAVHAISNASDPVQCAEDARVRFLEAAANPGLDLPFGTNTYQVAKDWCAMLETILRAVGRLTLLTIKSAGMVQLNSSTSWKTASFVDDSGTLHRWITVDRWDDDALSREMHGWHAFGDMAVLRAPMMIHAIEIGQMRKGRRVSPWARGWRHPSMPNVNGVHFKHKDGSSYSGWTPLHLADSDIAPDDWVDAMLRDRMLESLIHNVTLNAPSDTVCDATVQQILIEGARIESALRERGSTPWSALPMSRGSCDTMVPCPFQEACYSENIVDLSAIGMYTRRENVVVVKGG